MVASLAINPNTVLKAYRELEVKDLAHGRPGQGTFIQATLAQVALPELTALRRSLSSWLSTADTAGLDGGGIVALFTSALRDFYERRGEPRARDGRVNGKTSKALASVAPSGRAHLRNRNRNVHGPSKMKDVRAHRERGHQ